MCCEASLFKSFHKHGICQWNYQPNARDSWEPKVHAKRGRLQAGSGSYLGGVVLLGFFSYRIAGCRFFTGIQFTIAVDIKLF